MNGFDPEVVRQVEADLSEELAKPQEPTPEPRRDRGKGTPKWMKKGLEIVGWSIFLLAIPAFFIGFCCLIGSWLDHHPRLNVSIVEIQECSRSGLCSVVVETNDRCRTTTRKRYPVLGKPIDVQMSSTELRVCRGEYWWIERKPLPLLDAQTILDGFDGSEWKPGAGPGH